MAIIDDTTLFAALAKLKSNWPSRGWSWDTRLSCITSSFSLDFEADARDAAKLALPREYTSVTIATAPQPLKGLAEKSGGLRSGQILFAGGEPARTAFGLWWPWGTGLTISLRVGIVDADMDDDVSRRLRDLFGVSL